MNRKITYTYLLLIICSLWTLNLLGQSARVDIPSENVEVVKRFEASILEARKKKLTFKHDKRQNTAINYNYDVSTDKVIDFERPDPEIRPLGYKGEEVSQEDLHNGYIYGAYGTHQTINAGAAYHYFIEDWLDAGFKVDYLSTSDSLELSQRSFSDLNAQAYAGYHLGKQTKIRLNGFAERTNRQDANTFLSSGQFLDIPYNSYGTQFDVQYNVFEDSQFATRFGVGYTWKELGQDVSDRILHGDLNLIKTVSDKISIELPITYNRVEGQNSLEGSTEKLASEIVVEPNVRVKQMNFQAEAGVQFIRNDSTNLFFPIVDINLVSVFSGIDIRFFTALVYSRNSASNLFELNPYYNFNEFQSLDYSLSNIRSYNLEPSYRLNDFDFKLGLAYSQYRQEANFRTPEENPTVEFISRDEFSFLPSISYDPNEDIHLEVKGRYNLFLTDDLDLYYKPSVELSVTGKQFLLRHRLELTQYINFMGVRQFKQEQDINELEPFWDLGLKLRYKLSDHFDIFLQGSNLLGQDYALWQGQPVLQQQLWGGLKFRF